MPTVTHRQVKWVVSNEARSDFAEVRSDLGETYNANVASLRDLLCGYFSSDTGCGSAFGKTISPLGGASGTGKLLKVRWRLPGTGKSGGLRLAVAVFCNERRVVICRGWPRKDDPNDADFDAAGRIAGRYVADK